MAIYPTFPPCCENCEDRHVGCHVDGESRCSRYWDAKERHEEIKKLAEREQKRIEAAVDLCRRGAEKCAKRKYSKLG